MKIGDVVRLVGGGPKMTIIGRSSASFVICAWFDVNHCYQDEPFNEQVLSPVEKVPALDCL